MRIEGNLGFVYLVVLVGLVVAVIVFEIRRRWRRSVARAEEIRWLVAKVAEEEEAARAVFEGYAYADRDTPIDIDTRHEVVRDARHEVVRDTMRPIEIDTRQVVRDARHEVVRDTMRPIEIDTRHEVVRDTRRGVRDTRKIEIDTMQVVRETRNVEMDTRTVLYECALCLSPAKMRCSSCKAVRYCSGKCQILHWREGHRNNCRPFSTLSQFNNAGDGPIEKVSELPRNNFQSQESRSAAPVEKCDEAECLADVAGQGSSSDETSSDENNKKRNAHRLNNDATSEIPISDPYIPVSGFFEGTINSSIAKVGSNDDCSQPGSPFKLKIKPEDIIVNSGTANSTALGTKNSVDVNTQSVKECENNLSFFEKSNGISTCNTIKLTGSLSKEVPNSTHSPESSNMKPSSPQKATKGANGTGIIIDPMISKKEEILSSASAVNLCSSSLPSSKNGFKTSMLKVVDQLRVSKPSRQSELGKELTGRYIEKGLFPYDLFVKLYHWKKVEQLQPFGLLNCGNSCYANVVLQCLTCTPPLTAYFLQGLHSKACKLKEWCFACDFQSLMLSAKEGHSPLSPATILSHIHNIKSHFGNGKEEDAHEFLRYVIDTMQSTCLREVGARASGSLEEETTLIGLTFGGYLRSKIKCMKCGAKSEQFERLMDLTVEIEGDIGTLEEALRKFTSTEILDGENKYHCSRCRTYERAKKKFRVLEAPNVLTIALKRFQSGRFGKLNKWIQFPEILDLAPFMSGTSDKSPIYRLYGVIVHLDSMNATYSGHYVSYVKNAENRWFEINDSRVTYVDLDSVLANRAYMLFYARCSPRAPKLIKNLITRDFNKSRGSPVKSRSQSIGSWNVPSNDPLYDCRNGIESFHSVRKVFEEDSQSENASSIFSEECSCSTESSNRDYSSTDDHFGLNFFNYENNRVSTWRNSSGSDSPSSSSSSGDSVSPVYSTGKTSVQILDSEDTKNSKKLGSGFSSCRESHSNRLGWSNPFGNKKSSLLFRRSVRERTN